MSHKSTRVEHVFSYLILIGILGVIGFSIGKPSFLLTTIDPIGSDLGTHYYANRYLRDVLLPDWRVFGWDQGAFAGYPLYQFYHVLPALIVSALSLVVPFAVAFKFVFYVIAFLLPIGNFLALRTLNYRPIIAAIAAAFSLLSLYHTGQVIFGGNLASQLAGEYCFMMANSILPLYLALLYRGVATRSRVPLLALMLTVLANTHLVTFCAAVFSATFFVFCKPVLKNIVYLVKVHALALALLAGWIIPSFLKRQYSEALINTRDWFGDITGLLHLYPPQLLPLFVIVLVALLFHRFAAKYLDQKFLFFCFSAAIAFVCFNHPIVGWSGRFPPIAGLLMVPAAAIAIGNFVGARRTRMIGVTLALISMSCGLAFMSRHFASTSGSFKHVFSGLPARPGYAEFDALLKFLDNNAGSARVVAESSKQRGSLVTARSFEYLPYLTRALTMEGVYTPSALGYAAEQFIVRQVIHPVRASDAGYQALRLYNVGWIVTTTEQTRRRFSRDPRFKSSYRSANYEVFAVVDNRSSWIDVVQSPVHANSYENARQWKSAFGSWLSGLSRNGYLLSVDPHAPPFEADLYAGEQTGSLSYADNCILRQWLSPNDIAFKTQCPGRPHLIKVSYFPDWQVEGADRIFMVSPGLMLVYPIADSVHLTYGRDWINIFSDILSLIGLVALVVSLRRGRNEFHVHALLPARGAGLPLVAFIALYLFLLSPVRYGVMWFPQYRALQEAKQEMAAANYDAANKLLGTVRHTSLETEASYLKVMILLRKKAYNVIIPPLYAFINKNPQSEYSAELRYYHTLSQLEQRNYQQFEHEVYVLKKAHPRSPWAAKIDPIYNDWVQKNPELHEKYKEPRAPSASAK